MNILFHTQYYPPEVGAPQTRLHELAVRLTQRGFFVTVLTAMPNYPGGRIYNGYGGWFCEEILDGVKVIRTAIYPSQGTGVFQRLLSYFSFVLSSFWFGFWQVGATDIVLTESPPLFLGITGLALSRTKRAHWIFNISDLWPLSALELGFISEKGLSYRLSSALERFLYHQAWLVTGQSQGILENITLRFPNTQTYHLPNGVDTGFFQPGKNQPHSQNFHVVYAGLHGLAQGLEQVLLAALQLSTDLTIKFILVGDGARKQSLLSLAKELHLKNTDFVEPVSKEKVPGILQAADALLVPLKIQLTGAVPSKLYEAMAVGKPVILIAGGEAARIVEESECGLVVSPGDIASLAKAILFLKSNPQVARQMGENGRRIAVQNHDRGKITEHFADFLLNTLANGKIR